MQKWIDLLLKLLSGTFFVLTSCYALLASLPYTYYALIKSPAYAWMPWFVHHHALLYGLAVLSAAIAHRDIRTTLSYRLTFALLAVIGLGLLLNPILPSLQADATSYWVSLLALWINVLVATVAIWNALASSAESQRAIPSLPFGAAALLAIAMALVYAVAARLQMYTATHSFHFTRSDVYLTAWSMFSHLVALFLLISVLNLIRLAAARTARPRIWRWGLYSALFFVFVCIVSARFLQSAFSFEGWQVRLYAASLAAVVTLLSLSAAIPLALSSQPDSPAEPSGNVPLLSACSVVLLLAVLALHAFIGGADWNGFLQGTFAIGFWILFGFCFFRMNRQNPHYKLSRLLLVIFLAGFSYASLRATEIFWAKPLGRTDDDIQRAMANYASADVSFNLVHHLLGNGHTEICGEACRIMRTYTNVPNVPATFDLRLVDRLVPTSRERPDILLIVVDSLRPDYLGAYNPKVDFTPNLDAFARENIALRNVYTPYAGTSLSEPAIWAGALLLHSHYLQPFSRINSLEKLLRTDGYQMILSEDEVLSELIPPSKDIIRLDEDKKLWSQLELCSTIDQLESLLATPSSTSSPLFIYSQPKNVHQFATNSLPTATGSQWPPHPGFNYRISFEVHQVDECLGKFFAWLKARGRYENSIIMVTSDHGDATGEFGRTSHSLVLYPEIMRVPFLIHLPPALRNQVQYDDSRISSLTDITPSLYYLLGHRPIVSHPLFGHPLFTATLDELHSYSRDDLFLASDVRAAYGILAENGRYFYATYDSPPQSYLFDLTSDPNGEHDILTANLKRRYDQQVIDHLHALGNFYGYRAGLSSLTAAPR